MSNLLYTVINILVGYTIGLVTALMFNTSSQYTCIDGLVTKVHKDYIEYTQIKCIPKGE